MRVSIAKAKRPTPLARGEVAPTGAGARGRRAHRLCCIRLKISEGARLIELEQRSGPASPSEWPAAPIIRSIAPKISRLSASSSGTASRTRSAESAGSSDSVTSMRPIASSIMPGARSPSDWSSKSDARTAASARPRVKSLRS